MRWSESSTGTRRAGALRTHCCACAVLLAFALAACGGGGDNGGGNGNTNQVMVGVSPAAVAIVVNQTQLFVAGVTNARVAAIASANGAVRAANVVTITTTAAHGFMQGQIVTISSVTDASFNGTFTIASVPSTTALTYAQTGSDASSGGGSVSNNSVKWFVNDIEGGNLMVGTITTGGLYTAPAVVPAATTETIAASGAVRASNVVTITTTAAHTFVVNQIVTISGVTDASFNGLFVVASAPSTTTFTLNQTGANATSGGGTVSSTAVKVKAVSVADSTASATAIVSLDSGISVQVTPSSATVGTSETLQFFATVTGSADQTVNWFVNDIAGGNATVGMISPNGSFTAPATPPNANTATIAATGAVRSSNTVTITTTAAHTFLVNQIVTIAGVTDATFNGTFLILTVPSTTTFTYTQAAPDAMSGGGTASTASAPVTIKAVAAADSSRSGTASAQVVTASDPTLTSISPTTAAQGSAFEDLYLTGTNFISTTAVNVTGPALPPGATLPVGAVTVVGPTLIRVRIPASLLINPGMLSVDVQRQNGMPTASQSLTVVTVRPALVAASPDSGPQGGAPFPFNVNGGFYGTSLNPTAEFLFNGTARAFNVSTTNVGRQAGVTIGGADLSEAGLLAVGVRSTTDTTLFEATNLAVQPSAAPAEIGSPIPVGSLPSSVAINTATGMAVVANRGSSDLTIIDLTGMAPIALPGTIPVGPGPTGVAVDEIRNLAVVANNNSGGAGSISVVDLGGVNPTTTITTNIGNAPFSVGVNSLTGLALVVYQNTNHADIIDLTLVPPTVVSTATVSTGGSVAGAVGPQVAVDPRLNWAVVTPGGAGTLAIVDLSRRNTAAIAAAPNGATRTGGVATITTTGSHSLQQGQVVLISGVADASFNGVFTVAAVPSGTTFTYLPLGGAPNASGGGSITSTPPVATVGIGANTRGIGINPFTHRAILADPTTTAPVLFNLFDQLVTGVPIMPAEIGANAAAFNPFTDIAVTVNANTNQASIIDPRAPSRLFTATVGAGARAVAVDPGTNLALVVNETDGTVTVIQLSAAAIRSLHVAQVSLPVNRQLAPGITLSSTMDLPLTLIGKGFVGGSLVRLDGVALGPPSSVTDRMLTVNVPFAMLAAPSRYVVDVLNPGGVQSNVVDLTVVQPVDLVGAGGAACMTPAPAAVAIDGQRDLALVANSGCDSVSLIDLNSGAVTNTIAVGDNPQGVGVSSRLGRAVITNRSAGTASILDLTAMTPAVTSTVTTGSEPLGVAISENSGQALVANATSGTLSVFDATSGGLAGTVTVDVRPVAVAVDPVRNLALVVHAAQNTAAVVNLASLSIAGRVSNLQLPTAAAFDAASGLFIANSSVGNNLAFINPNTFQATFVRSGINPTSIGHNYRSSTLVTVNTASRTISVLDLLENRIRAVVGISGAPQFAVAIHPRSNLVVLVDQANHRVLLMPLPR